MRGSLSGRQKGTVGPRSLDLLPLLSLREWIGVRASSGLPTAQSGEEDALVPAMLVLGRWFEMSHRCLHHLSPASPPQSAASQSQSIPAISQAPQSGAMGYMGSQSVSMGYQPYGMQVSAPCHAGPFLGTGGDEARVGSSPWSLPGPALRVAGKGEAWQRLWASTSAPRALCVPQPH